MRERVKQFEQMNAAGGAAATAGPPGFATTQFLVSRIEELQEKTNRAASREECTLPDNSLLSHITTQAAQLNALGARHDGVCASVMVQDTRISALEQHATQIQAQLNLCAPSRKGNTLAKYSNHRHLITELVGMHNELQEDSQWEEVYEALTDLQEGVVEEIRDTLTETGPNLCLLHTL